MEENKLKEKISVAKILNVSFSLWKDNFLKIPIVMTIVFIPVQIIIEFVSVALSNVYETSSLYPVTDWRRIANEARVYDAIRQIIGITASLGIFNFIYKKLKNKDEERSSLDIVLFGLKKWPENFIQTLIAGMITLVFFLLLIIPGIYKAVQYSFVSNIVADEEDSPLQKSKFLVKDNWFRVFGMILLIFVIGFMIELVVIIPFMMLPDNLIFTIITGVIALASSYTIVIQSVFYYKMKIYKSEVEKVNPDFEKKNMEI